MEGSTMIGVRAIRWSVVLMGVTFVAASWPVVVAMAVPRSWIGGSGSWSTPGLWSPSGIPGAADDVSIAPIDGVSRTVTYDYGGAAVTLNSLVVDLNAVASGTTTLLMPGNNLTVTHQHVGFNGSGTLRQSGGTWDVVDHLRVGTNLGSTGEVTVSGAGTSLESAWLSLGASGEGSLTIEDGGLVTVENKASIGDALSGQGTVIVRNSDSVLNILGWMDVGYQGRGSLSILDGGRVTDAGGMFVAGHGDGEGHVLVNGANSRLNVGWINVGTRGLGTLLIESGGEATSTSGVHIGENATAVGTITVDGADSRLESSWYIVVGANGDGTLNVLDGAEAVAPHWFSIADAALGAGQATISGAGSSVSGGWGISVGNHGQGALTLENGGTASTPGWFIVGKENGSDGTLHVDSGGSATTDQEFVIGELVGSVGDVTISGATSQLQATWSIAVGSAGRGTLTANGGATVSADGGLTVGGADTGVGNATFHGSGTHANINGSITVGRSGNGTLQIENGATAVSGAGFYLGYDASGVGTATITGEGSSVEAPWGILVGTADGEGTLNIEDGGLASSSGPTIIAQNAGSQGRVYVRGEGAAIECNWVEVGREGGGELTVENGGSVSTTGDFNIAVNPGGTGTMNVNDGGTVFAATGVHVGGWWNAAGGAGDLNVDGGTLNVPWPLHIWNAPGNAVNLRSGTINTSALNFDGNPSLFRWTGGTLHITSSVTFDPSATPDSTSAAFGASRTVSGSRKLKITGDETLGWTGVFGLHVSSGGEHEVTGAIAISSNGALHLQNGGTVTANAIQHTSGGTFAFTGGTLHVNTFHGNLNNSGGTLAPGTSPGTTIVNGDYRQSAGTLQIEIGPSAYDKLVVNGNVTFGGTLQVLLLDENSPSAGAEFNILDWTGTSSGSFALALPALGGALTWNLSQLYSDGVLSVDNSGAGGDANADGLVDAADYVAWRKRDGSNEPAYVAWRQHFGEPAMGGSASGDTDLSRSGVPEPGSLVLLLLAGLHFAIRARRLSHVTSA
jgi:T5SS/PEP-CTERM-associated repeat protein